MNDGVIFTCGQCGQKNRVAYGRLLGPARCGSCKHPLREPGTVMAVDALDDLEGVLKNAGAPVLVDFWAPWCGPCRQVAPEVAKVAARHKDDLLVLKVNTDVDRAVGARFGISSIPTMAVFHQGREVGRTSGARPASAIESWVSSVL